jgi:hypothetical protein
MDQFIYFELTQISSYPRYTNLTTLIYARKQFIEFQLQLTLITWEEVNEGILYNMKSLRNDIFIN